MPGESDSLAQTVRQQLERGAAVGEITESLVARGLSPASAQRFVERVLAEPPPSAAADAPADRPFPWVRALWIGAIPIAAVAGVVAFAQMQRAREARAALAAADQARAEEIRRESLLRRANTGQSIDSRQSAEIEKAVDQLTKSGNPSTQCDAALRLGRLGAASEVFLLAETMSSARTHSVRACAASGLRELGETRTVLEKYVEWASGDEDDLRRSAIVGFGEIGPPAAGTALPFLTEAFQSPEVAMRFLVVDAAAKLGPALEPLMKKALGDPDGNVRQRAQIMMSQRK